MTVEQTRSHGSSTVRSPPGSLLIVLKHLLLRARLARHEHARGTDEVYCMRFEQSSASGLDADGYSDNKICAIATLHQVRAGWASWRYCSLPRWTFRPQARVTPQPYLKPHMSEHASGFRPDSALTRQSFRVYTHSTSSQQQDMH